MDIENILLDIQNINLTNVQIIFLVMVVLLLLMLTIYLTKRTCCQNCVDLDKYNNKFQNQQF
jgi:hypothetical protein